jgi:hypothetical protein
VTDALLMIFVIGMVTIALIVDAVAVVGWVMRFNL